MKIKTGFSEIMQVAVAGGFSIYFQVSGDALGAAFFGGIALLYLGILIKNK